MPFPTRASRITSIPECRCAFRRCVRSRLYHIFAIESFIDELARTANADPVDSVCGHPERSRAADVIRSAAGQFGWANFAADATHLAIRPRAYFARYKNLAAYAAVAMDVEVERETVRFASAASWRRSTAARR